MKNLISLFSGIVFGIGLILSGMTNPAKVIGFLDITGNWDPSLALVMGGAILVALPAFQFAKRRQKTLLNQELQLPSESRIDAKLVVGALVFGVGWGLSGYCPGPAVASLTTGGEPAWVFVSAMLAGILLYKRIH